MINVPIINPNIETRPLPGVADRTQVNPTQVGTSRIRPSEINVSSANYQPDLDQANVRAFEALGKIGDAFYDRGNKIMMISAQRQSDEVYMDVMGRARDLRGKNAFAMQNTLGKEYDDRMEKVRESLANDDQRLAFDEMSQARRRSVYGEFDQLERREMDVYAKEETDAAVNTSIENAAFNYSDPLKVDQSIAAAKSSYRAYAEIQGTPEAAIIAKEVDIERQARVQVLTRLASDDPEGFLEIADGVVQPLDGFDAAADWVLKKEGGYVADDAGKGETNFGINSAANPDVNVKDLTPDGAKAIYKERYWNAIGADNLEPPMALAAFDAAINQGVGKAKEMLEESGGDVNKFISIRDREYKKLAKANPQKFGKYYDSWMTRLSSLRIAAAGDGETGLPSFDVLGWKDQQSIIKYAAAEVSRRDEIYEKNLKKYQEQNGFNLYSRLTSDNAEDRQGITKDSIKLMVNQQLISGADGRKMIDLMATGGAKEDNLQTYSELSKREASGELTIEDIISAQANNQLTNATAKTMINSITTNLSSNEAYKSGVDLIKAEFDKSDFGITIGDAANKEAEALREYQRRVATGEKFNDVSTEIIERLRKTANSDRAYQKTLSSIRKDMGIDTSNPKLLEDAASQIMDLSSRNKINKQDAEMRLNALKRRIEELEGGI